MITGHPSIRFPLSTLVIVELRSRARVVSRSYPGLRSALQTALSFQDGAWMRLMFHGYLESDIDTASQRGRGGPLACDHRTLESCPQTQGQKSIQGTVPRRADPARQNTFRGSNNSRSKNGGGKSSQHYWNRRREQRHCDNSPRWDSGPGTPRRNGHRRSSEASSIHRRANWALTHCRHCSRGSHYLECDRVGIRCTLHRRLWNVTALDRA